MRTYSKEHFIAAYKAWQEGDFGPEWRPFARLAAERGFIYPPEGTKWDQANDLEPTQRAVIYQLIEECPGLLREAIGKSRSWWEVLRYALWKREGIREDVDFLERDARWEKGGEPTGPQATRLLADIMSHIRDSV